MVLPFAPIDLVLHFDKYLPLIIQEYGFWTYAVLFLILFCETGLVVTPYFPGDSLLFVAGALAGAGFLDIGILLVSLMIAAILGDTLNYWIGYTFELKVLEWKYSLVKKEHLAETHAYFERFGGFTIFVARFVPFIRTFAPFLAGIGKMRYSWFLGYNVLGGVAWVSAFLLAGYFFGNLPIVQENFSLVIYAIIGLSLIAFASVFIRIMRKMRSEQVTGTE